MAAEIAAREEAERVANAARAAAVAEARAAAVAEEVRQGKMTGAAIMLQSHMRRVGATAVVSQKRREVRLVEDNKARLRAVSRAAIAQTHLIQLHQDALRRADSARSICALFRAVIAKGVVQMMKIKAREKDDAAVIIGAFIFWRLSLFLPVWTP